MTARADFDALLASQAHCSCGEARNGLCFDSEHDALRYAKSQMDIGGYWFAEYHGDCGHWHVWWSPKP